MSKATKLARGDKRKDSKSQKKVVTAEIADEVVRVAPKSKATTAAPSMKSAPAPKPATLRASASGSMPSKTGAARPPRAPVLQAAPSVMPPTMPGVEEARQAAKTIEAMADETASSVAAGVKQVAKTVDSVAKDSAKTLDAVTEKASETVAAGAATSGQSTAAVARELDKGMEAAAATLRPAAPTLPGSPAVPSAEKAQRSFARAVETWQRSVQAAGCSAVTVNCTILGFAQETMNSSLELARDLASARTPVEAARLQLGFWQDWLDACDSHSKTLRQAALELAAHARAPVRDVINS